MKAIFSPDVLAANPDLAAKLKRSKAQTPSGQGHGHTDNEQRYDPTPYSAPAGIHCAAKIALSLIKHHAARWPEHGQDKRVTNATAALDVLVRWLGQPAVRR
jgi:hypothetical protein